MVMVVEMVVVVVEEVVFLTFNVKCASNLVTLPPLVGTFSINSFRLWFLQISKGFNLLQLTPMVDHLMVWLVMG